MRAAARLCGARRIVRRVVVIVKPDVVRFRDIRQPVDGIQHLRQAPLVFLVHGSQQIHRLRQRFVAFGELFEAFVNGHGVPGICLLYTSCLNIDRRDPGGAVRAGISSGVGRYADAV